jgi:hypothetical protein
VHEKKELTDVGWLGLRDEMDRAIRRFGKCFELARLVLLGSLENVFSRNIVPMNI